jgi:hypothetical protein
LSVADAAYAAVPVLLALCAASPAQDRRLYIELIAFIEGCRQAKENFVAEMPPDHADAYFAALGTLPQLIAECAVLDWDQGYDDQRDDCNLYKLATNAALAGLMPSSSRRRARTRRSSSGRYSTVSTSHSVAAGSR